MKNEPKLQQANQTEAAQPAVKADVAAGSASVEKRPETAAEILEREIRYAEQVAKSRIEAPNVNVSIDEADVLTQAADTLKQMGLVPDEWHVVFRTTSDHLKSIRDGEVPVLLNGEHFGVNELLAYRVPDVVRQRKQALASKQATDALQSHIAAGEASAREVDENKMPPQVRAQWQRVKEGRERLARIGRR